MSITKLVDGCVWFTCSDKMAVIVQDLTLIWVHASPSIRPNDFKGGDVVSLQLVLSADAFRLKQVVCVFPV